MRLFILSIFLFLFIAPVMAQSITGSWKRLSATIEYMDGRKEDLHKTMITGLPCAAEMQYIFKTDGTHFSKSPKGCEAVDAMSKATWKQTGNTLVLVTANEAKLKVAGTTYTLSFSGNTVTMTHVYTAMENAVTKIKPKKLVVVYQRI